MTGSGAFDGAGAATAAAGRWRYAAILLCFFMSGAAALVYEIVFSRLLVRLMGASLPAVSAVLAAFMGGMAIGALVAGRRADRLTHPLRAYALAELIAGLSALAVPFALSQGALKWLWLSLGTLADPASAPGFALRLTVALVVLFAPTVAMGATLPLVSRYFAGRAGQTRRRVGFLYASNTLGAVGGCVAGGFLLIPTLGLTQSVVVGSVVSFVVAAIAWRLDAQGPRLAIGGEDGEPQPLAGEALSPSHEASPAWMVALALFVAGLAGALAMVLEVVWTRLFSLVLGSTTYGLTAVVAGVLAGTAAGAAVSARLAGKVRRPLLAIVLCQLLSALTILAFLLVVNELPWMLVRLTQMLARPDGSLSFEMALLARAATAFVVVVWPAALSGAVFPLALAVVAQAREKVSRAVGDLYFINTAGAIFGALTAGLVLIPGLSEMLVSGMQASLILVALIQAITGALVAVAWLACIKEGRRRPLMYALAGGTVFALGLSSFILGRISWNTALISSGACFSSAMEFKDLTREKFMSLVGANGAADEPHVEFYREGLNTTVTVVADRKANSTVLKNDGKVDAGVPLDLERPAPQSAMVTQVLLGALPALLNANPQSCFVVGYGSGTTIGTLLAFKEVAHVTAAELEAAVLNADPFFRHANNDPLGPAFRQRLTSINADGRNYLAATKEEFDIIVSQPADPWVNGMSDLFTREYFKLGRSHMKPSGLFCQWVQLYAITPEYLRVIARTFQQVFPHTLVFNPPGAGEIILVGSDSPLAIDVEKVRARFRQDSVRRYLSRAGYRQLEDVLATLVLGPVELANLCASAGGDDLQKVNTDDNLLTEYALPRQLFSEPGLSAKTMASVERPDLDVPRALGGRLDADFLGGMAIAYATNLKDGDFDLLYSRQALTLSSAAMALSPSPISFAARALTFYEFGAEGDEGLAWQAASQAKATTGAEHAAAACAFARRRQLAKAREEAEAALKMAPDSASVLAACAFVSLAAGEPDAALARADRALAQDPLLTSAHLVKALALNRRGQREKAVSVLRESLRVDPTQFAARLWLGKMLCDSGDSDSGLMQLRLASRVSPHERLPFFCVAAHYALSGNCPAALVNIRLASKRPILNRNGARLEWAVYTLCGDQDAAEAAASNYSGQGVDLPPANQARKVIETFWNEPISGCEGCIPSLTGT